MRPEQELSIFPIGTENTVAGQYFIGQSYLSVLSQLANDCLIIVASHSPYIIQYLDTKDIYIGKPNDQGLADFARVDKKKINQLMRDASSESNSLGSYIFELLSGGEDEIAILMNYLEK